MRSLGFQAAVDRVDGSEAVIRTPTCPFRPVVQACADAAALDRGLWSALLARVLRGGAAATITCETHGCLDPGASCEVRLKVER